MAGQTSTDPNVFILPDLGEGVHEAELVSWKVSPGDHVEEHQVVAEMETDKALVEVPSPREGVIKELFGSPGEILKVGSPAWTYEGAGSGSAPPTPAPVSGGVSGGDSGGSSGGRTGGNGQATAASASGEREDAGTVVGTMSGELKGVAGADGRALATPAVRRLARDLGVDIDRVTGTGLAGRVTERDVRGAAPAQAAGTAGGDAAPMAEVRRRPDDLATTITRQSVVADRPAPLVPAGEASRVPFRGVRRTIANRLRASVDSAVHFTVMDDADVSSLDDVRRRVGAASGEKVSYLPFVAAAVCRALKDFPGMNATVDDEREEIVRHAPVHLGIAADTEHGLTVPVIPDADRLGLLEIGRHVAQLAALTRDRTIPRDRLSGSTFTISNVGSYAGKYATPIINAPEVGILAVGRVYDGVVADRGAIRVAKLLPLSMTCDHRAVDGADAARCLARVIELLHQPESLLAPARG